MLPALETCRLTLRELAPDDAPALQVWQNSPMQWRHMAVEPAEFSDAAARIGNYLKYRGDDTNRRLFVYAARCKQDGALIGSVSLARLHPEIASLGLSVAASHGGRGYGTGLPIVSWPLGSAMSASIALLPMWLSTIILACA